MKKELQTFIYSNQKASRKGSETMWNYYIFNRQRINSAPIAQGTCLSDSELIELLYATELMHREDSPIEVGEREHVVSYARSDSVCFCYRVLPVSVDIVETVDDVLSII